MVSYSCGMAVSLLALVMYYGDENSQLHRSAVERVFWPCIFCAFAHTNTWLDDAPLVRLGVWRNDGFVANAVVCLLAALLGAALQTRNSERRMQSPYARQQTRRYQESVAARVATSRIRGLLDSTSAFPFASWTKGRWELQAEVHRATPPASYLDS